MSNACRKRKHEAPRRFVYLIGHYLNVSPSTHINHTDNDPLDELARHNNVSAGGVRETKKAVGHWRLLLFMFVPAERRIDTRELVERWRAACRTVYHRLMWGLEAAARLVLLCHANDEPLRTSEARSKLPRRKLEKVLAKLRAGGQPEKLTPDYVARCVERYVSAPRQVLAARQSGVPSAAYTSAQRTRLSQTELDALNTLPASKRSRRGACCLTKKAAESGALSGAMPIGALADSEATNSGTGNTNAVALVRELAALQQSNAFCETKADDQVTALAVHAAAPLGRLMRNESESEPLRDALCVNMRDARTSSSMDAQTGAARSVCVCGTPRTANDVRSVVLEPNGAPTAAHVCVTCGRSALAYQLYSISTQSVKSKLEPLAQRANSTPLGSLSPCSTSSEAEPAQASLFSTFSDAEYQTQRTAPAPSQRKATTTTKRVRTTPRVERAFKTPTHSSLKLLSSKPKDTALASNMMLLWCK